MAAPTATIRQSPTGIKLVDGFSTKIAFARDPDVSFWEKTVAPPGVDGGDPIPQTTMHNVTWRTQAPRSLKTLTNSTLTVAYDPAVYTQIVELINIVNAVTCHFRDGSSVAFWGYLKDFIPTPNAEGSQPEANVTIVPSNYDPANGAESSVTVASIGGT